MYKLFVGVVFFISASAFALPNKDFGNEAERYISSCYGLEHFKSQYCPKQPQIKPAMCVSNAVSLVPSEDRNEVSKMLNKSLARLKLIAISVVDSAFKNAVASMGGYNDELCIHLGSVLNTMSYGHYEKLKVISKQ